MSEDSGFIGNKPQKKEREYAPDFFGSLGKGMLANEALKNAPGLTPLSFSVDIHEKVRDIMSAGDGFSTSECTENTEKIRKSSGLTPLSHRDEPQMNADKRRYGLNIFSSAEMILDTETDTRRGLSGLSVPLSLRGEFHKRGVI